MRPARGLSAGKRPHPDSGLGPLPSAPRSPPLEVIQAAAPNQDMPTPLALRVEDTRRSLHGGGPSNLRKRSQFTSNPVTDTLFKITFKSLMRSPGSKEQQKDVKLKSPLPQSHVHPSPCPPGVLSRASWEPLQNSFMQRGAGTDMPRCVCCARACDLALTPSGHSALAFP